VLSVKKTAEVGYGSEVDRKCYGLYTEWRFGSAEVRKCGSEVRKSAEAGRTWLQLMCCALVCTSVLFRTERELGNGG